MEADAMNNIQRRLFRAFVEGGGDISEEAAVEKFIRYVEGHVLLLPPRVRSATELVWRNPDGVSYAHLAEELSRREGTPLSAAALRQRMSRGMRELERIVRRLSWDGLSALPNKPGSLKLGRPQ